MIYGQDRILGLSIFAKSNHKDNHQPLDQASKDNKDLVAYAVSLGRAGLFGKACKVLETGSPK